MVEELSKIDAARRRAARAAAADMRNAFTDGDDGLRRAAAAALWHSLTQLDPDRTRDMLDIPDDAGPYREALVAILHRIPDGWGRWISCDAGWYPLICELDSRLAAVDPGYELHQVKEKFGALRYYFRSSPGLSAARQARMHSLVEAAEDASETLCERCGQTGSRHRRPAGTLKTLCPNCASVLAGYERHHPGPPA